MAADDSGVSIKPVCPECGRELELDEKDTARDEVWCPGCACAYSFLHVAEYSLVKATLRNPPPKGLSVTREGTDGEVVVDIHTPRWGLRLIGCALPLLLSGCGVGLLCRLLHPDVGGRTAAMLTGGILVLGLLLAWVGVSAWYEWRLHQVLRLEKDRCSASVRPTWFKPRVQTVAFDADASFAFAPVGMFTGLHVFSPLRRPQLLNIHFPLNAKQKAYLFACLVDVKRGVTAGTFRAGPPRPGRPAPMPPEPPSLLQRIWHGFVILLCLALFAAKVLQYLGVLT